jgi:hypothetical protein
MECKGSWKLSSNNIKYTGNILDCNLRAINGDYIPNKIYFFPEYEYSNIDGKFEWNNCKNNVELNNTSHDHIKRRYKKITIKECLNNLTNEYDDWFEVEEKYINNIQEKCISISLFKKNSDNTYDNEYLVDENKWLNKYYNSLINNLKNFNLKNICINLYLANDLKNYISELIKFPFLNIFLMKSNSIGAQPGTLWRFMDITNKSYKKVFICDIDDNWDWIKIWNNKNYNYKLCTLKPKDKIISNNPYTPAYNFATIIGSHIMVNPNKFNYNIVDVIKGFITLCKNRENSKNPYCFNDNDKITFWNQPVFDHKLGWGRIITKYGFDEFFLKHVIYYDAYPDLKFI